MYSTQSLLCPARPSGLKSQGHLVPPTKKKKAATNTSSYKDDESGFLLEEKLLPGNHVQKQERIALRVCLSLLALTDVSTPLWGLSVHQLQRSGPTQALGRLRRGSKPTQHMKELKGNLMTQSSPTLQASSSMSKLSHGGSEGSILCAFISH